MDTKLLWNLLLSVLLIASVAKGENPQDIYGNITGPWEEITESPYQPPPVDKEFEPWLLPCVPNAPGACEELNTYKSALGESTSPFVLAQVTPAPCIGIECNVIVPTQDDPANDANFVPSSPSPEVEVVDTAFEIYPDSGIFSQFPDHITAEQHYYHCNLHNLELINALNEAVPNEPNCDVSMSFFGGRLWKPVSESNGRPVVLFPANYPAEPTPELWTANGFIENLTFRPTLPGQNGGRVHWNASRQCGQYPALTMVVTLGDVRECYSIPKPCDRFD